MHARMHAPPLREGVVGTRMHDVRGSTPASGLILTCCSRSRLPQTRRAEGPHTTQHAQCASQRDLERFSASRRRLCARGREAMTFDHRVPA